MRKLMNLTILLLAVQIAFAQPTKETSDPKATAILEKLRKQYEAYTSIEVAFSFTMEIPEQKKEVQKGKLVQQGDKYYIDMAKQAIICDGKTVWLHQKQNKEVQINNADANDNEAILSPKDLIRIYQGKEYTYAITGEGTENGKAVQYIEFKPNKRSSEYAKLRLSIEKKTGQFVNIKAFSKDGSRYTMNIDSLTNNKKYAPAYFTFDKTKFPGVKIEDLRID